MRYAPLADTRLVAAVFVFRPYAAKPIGASGCQGCAALSGARLGLDAGASEDYIVWPSKDGKPQRLEAGQESGPRALPTREASLAMGSLPQRPDPRHTARPVQDRSTYPGSAATHEGRGGTLPPHGPPATASASSGTDSTCDRGSLAPKPGEPDLDAGALRHYIPNGGQEREKTAEDPWQERHSR